MEKIFDWFLPLKKDDGMVLRGLRVGETAPKVRLHLVGDGGEGADISGCTVVSVIIERSDGDKVAVTLPMSSVLCNVPAVIELTFDDVRMTAVPGLCEGIVDIYSGERRMTSARLRYYVEPSIEVTDDEVAADAEYSMFVGAMSDLAQLNERVSVAEEARNVFEQYDAEKKYVRGNKVAFNGSSYVLIEDSSKGVSPSESGNWLLIASKGEKGDKGEQGTQGEQGEKGSKGDKGEDGKDFKILGYYSSLGALDSVVTSPDVGDAYAIGEGAPYDIYIYDEKIGWVNNGPIAAGIELNLRDGTAENSLEGVDSEENPAISLGEGCVSLGDGCVSGCMGYYIQAIDFNNRNIYLTDTKVDGLPTVGEGIVTDLRVPYVYNVTSQPVQFSIINGNHYPLCGTIASIENNVVTYKGSLGFNGFVSDTDVDGHTFCVPSQPTVGAVSFVTGAVSIGENVVNAGKCSFGVGRDLLLAEGYGTNIGRRNTTAYGSIALGVDNYVPVQFGIGIGNKNTVTGYAGIALGDGNEVTGEHASCIGNGLKALRSYQSVRGFFNIPDTDLKYLEIVGNGGSDTDRKNVYTLDTKGNARFTGKVYVESENAIGEGKELMDAKAVDMAIKDKLDALGLLGSYKTYGVSIDLSNSNPESSVTYIDDAAGMVAGSSDWYKMSIFKNIKPCLFKDGAVVGYLNPDNFSQFEDGTAADITSGNSGDVMIEIPKMGYKISKSGTSLTIRITDDPNRMGYSYKAHTRTQEGDREKLYIGAFLGRYSSGKLRSLSGASPLNRAGLIDFRAYAQANGTGYDILSFYPLTLLQCLYLIMYKNLNSQSALGRGYVGGSGGATLTGSTIGKGMCYGSISGFEHVKFLGVEDFWGNLRQWIDGFISTSDYHALVATDAFNSTGENYTDMGALSTKYIGGFMTKPYGSNDTGFVIGSAGGSDSTYFSDYADFNADSVPIFGGGFSDSSYAGAFRLGITYKPSSNGDPYVGGRLMYL